MSSTLDTRIRSAVRWLDAVADADREVRVFGASMHRWAPIDPFAEDALAPVEAKLGVRLPEEYRRFVTTIARGGAGPYYGLLPLDAAPESLQPLGDPNVPFDPAARKPTDGTILLADQGCGSVSVLAVRGAHAGEVWTVGDGRVLPEARSFIGWLEDWLRGATLRWAVDMLPRIADGDEPTERLDAPLVVHYVVAALEWRGEGAEPEFSLYAPSLPSPAEAMRARGLLAALRGERELGRTWLDRAAAAEEKEPVARAGLDRARLGRLLGDHALVVAATAEGLAGPRPWADTEGVLLRHRLAALDALGQSDDAIEVAERLAAQAYFAHAAHYALAGRLVDRGDWAAVERALLRAAARPPTSTSMDATPREAALAVLAPFAARLETEGHTERAAWARGLAARFADVHEEEPPLD